MAWLLITPMVLLAAALLVVPGIALCRAIGIRGAAALAMAPPLSVSLIGVLAIIYAAVKVPWSLSAFSLGVAATSLLALGGRILLQRRTGLLELRWVGLSWRALALGMLTWSLLAGYAMVRLFRSPPSVIQSFDNVFHLNAVQYALDTGQASSLTISGLTSGGAPPAVNPAAWHGFVALLLGTARSVAPLTPIGTAVNAATIAVILLGWALGCLLLTQVLIGGRPSTSLVVALFLGSLYAFPWIFLPEGGLYPNLLGDSLIPAGTAWLILLAGRFGRPSPRPVSISLAGSHHTALALVSMMLAVPGIGLAHPNSLIALLGIALLIAWGRRRVDPEQAPRERVRSLAALVLATLALGLVWVLLAPARPTDPKPSIGLGQAIWWLLQGGLTEGGRPAPTITVLALVGVVACVLRRDWASLLLAGFGAAIFVFAIGGPTATISQLAGALLYNDSERIGAFALICALPLLIAAVGEIVAVLRRFTLRLTSVRIAPVAVVGALGLILAVPLQATSLVPALGQASHRLVVLGADTRRMNRDEYRLIVRMRELVPPGEKVIADPTTGGGFIYGLSGVPLVFPHAYLTDNPAMRQLRSQMFNPHQLVATCAAMDSLGAHYFYYPGRFIYHATEGPDAFPALDEPDFAMLNPVATEGRAALYRFSACG